MKLLQILIALTVIIFAGSIVQAVDSNGAWNVRGMGAASCGEYIGAELSEHRWFEHWMMGYLSGANHYRDGGADFTNGIAAKSLTLWVENYCKEHPLSNFSDAIDMLIEEIRKK